MSFERLLTTNDGENVNVIEPKQLEKEVGGRSGLRSIGFDRVLSSGIFFE